MEGYKIFIGNKDNFVNNYGSQFKEGVVYETNQEICPKKTGYHFAKRLEDTLRYGTACEEDVIICKVTALGKIIEYEDEYYGYYDLFVTNKIRIDKILTREEIIKYALELSDYRLERFIQTMKLSDEEAKLFMGRSTMIDKYILFYHYNDKNAFNSQYTNGEKTYGR